MCCGGLHCLSVLPLTLLAAAPPIFLKYPKFAPPLIFTYSPVRIIEIQKEYIKYRIYVLIKGKSYSASSLSDLYFFKFHLNDLYFIFQKITGVNKIIGERAKCSCKQNFVICGVLLQS